MTRPAAFMPSRGHARYFVRYPEGFESMAMPKHIAEDYAKIFGGTVHLDANIPPESKPEVSKETLSIVLVAAIVIVIFLYNVFI